MDSTCRSGVNPCRQKNQLVRSANNKSFIEPARYNITTIIFYRIGGASFTYRLDQITI